MRFKCIFLKKLKKIPIEIPLLFKSIIIHKTMSANTNNATEKSANGVYDMVEKHYNRENCEKFFGTVGLISGLVFSNVENTIKDLVAVPAISALFGIIFGRILHESPIVVLSFGIGIFGRRWYWGKL
jgi:uncharacterized protein YacL